MIGKFAMTSLKTALAWILRNYELEYVCHPYLATL